MKKILSILFSILLVIPTLGFHIDLTHCCGDIQGVGLSHEVNLNVTDCCDMENDSSCSDGTELTQSPVYQNLSISQETTAPDAFFFDQPRTGYFQQSTHRDVGVLSNTCIIPPPPHISLFQVFLC
ncbi:MAG: hypothetical protein ACPGTP_09275 [Bacteroidia bacterium]